MPTSATGSRRPDGFTLIELLVVLAILGLMSAAVVLALPDPRGSLRSEAERFAARAQAASERAVLDARPMAIRVTASGYGFDRRERDGWRPLATPPFEDQRWTEGTSAAGATGRITFDSTGAANPAQLVLQRGDDRLVVEIGHDGGVRVGA